MILISEHTQKEHHSNKIHENKPNCYIYKHIREIVLAYNMDNNANTTNLFSDIIIFEDNKETSHYNQILRSRISTNASQISHNYEKQNQFCSRFESNESQSNNKRHHYNS